MPVKKRGKKWQARFRWYDDKGKQQSISKTFTLKSDAEDWYLDRQKDHQQGVNKRVTTFLWLYDRYYNLYKKDYLRHNSQMTWDYSRNKFVEYFGKDRTIQSLTTDDYQSFLNDLGGKLSHSSVKAIHQCVALVFDYAMQSGYINRNPTHLVRVGGKKPRKVEYLTIKQIKAVLKYCRNYGDNLKHKSIREGKNVPVGTPVLIEAAILSGCRLGELSGLTWDNVDVKNDVFHIVRQISTRPSSTSRPFMDLKTDNSRRDIPVPHYLISDMLAIRDSEDKLCFYTQRNQPVSTSSVSRYVHRMMDRLGFKNENFHFHSFRHSHVALLLSQGVDIYAISRRLGHNNIRTTLQIYSYLIKEKEEKEDKKILKVLNSL